MRREFQHKISKIRMVMADRSSLGTMVSAGGAEVCVRKSYYDGLRSAWERRWSNSPEKGRTRN